MSLQRYHFRFGLRDSVLFAIEPSFANETHVSSGISKLRGKQQSVVGCLVMFSGAFLEFAVLSGFACFEFDTFSFSNFAAPPPILPNITNIETHDQN